MAIAGYAIGANQGYIYVVGVTADILLIVNRRLCKAPFQAGREACAAAPPQPGPLHDVDDFYKKQMRVALRNCGVINPEDINEYIAYDGYQAIAISRRLTAIGYSARTYM